MSMFSIFLRSTIVLAILAIIIVPMKFEKHFAEPVAEISEKPVENLFGVSMANEEAVQDKEAAANKIFSRRSYAYLADETQNADQTPTYRPNNDTANRLAVAHVLSNQGQLNKALIILENVKTEDVPSYDVRLMRAKIMSRSDQFQSAENIFNALYAEFPHDPDILVAYGFSKYAQGDMSSAEAMFSKVLANYPGYADAKEGISRVRKAKRQ